MGCVQAKKGVIPPPMRTLSTAKTNLEPALIHQHRELSVDHNLCTTRRESAMSRHNDIDNAQMEHQLLRDLTRGELQMDAHGSLVFDNPDGLQRDFSQPHRRSDEGSQALDVVENRPSSDAPRDLLRNLSDDQQKRCTEVAENIARYSMKSPIHDNALLGEFPKAGNSSTSIEDEGNKEERNAIEGAPNASGDNAASAACSGG